MSKERGGLVKLRSRLPKMWNVYSEDTLWVTPKGVKPLIEEYSSGVLDSFTNERVKVERKIGLTGISPTKLKCTDKRAGKVAISTSSLWTVLDSDGEKEFLTSNTPLLSGSFLIDEENEKFIYLSAYLYKTVTTSSGTPYRISAAFLFDFKGNFIESIPLGSSSSSNLSSIYARGTLISEGRRGITLIEQSDSGTRWHLLDSKNKRSCTVRAARAAITDSLCITELGSGSTYRLDVALLANEWFTAQNTIQQAANSRISSVTSHTLSISAPSLADHRRLDFYGVRGETVYMSIHSTGPLWYLVKCTFTKNSKETAPVLETIRTLDQSARPDWSGLSKNTMILAPVCCSYTDAYFIVASIDLFSGASGMTTSIIGDRLLKVNIDTGETNFNDIKLVDIGYNLYQTDLYSARYFGTSNNKSYVYLSTSFKENVPFMTFDMNDGTYELSYIINGNVTQDFIVSNKVDFRELGPTIFDAPIYKNRYLYMKGGFLDLETMEMNVFPSSKTLYSAPSSYKTSFVYEGSFNYGQTSRNLDQVHYLNTAFKKRGILGTFSSSVLKTDGDGVQTKEVSLMGENVTYNIVSGGS